ncbi:5127_t:CDS:2, partial [Acaulospora colombiana]
MPRAAHPDRSASASETITHNEHAMATGTTKRPLAHDEDDSLKKSTKKKRSFWRRLFSCFNPCLDDPEAPHDIHVTRDPRNAAYAKRAEDDDKADSNKLTDETMVQTSPSRAGSNGAASTTLHATSAVPSPHLTIPSTPVVITAPSTPTYNTFDLDPDPDVVIPPTPKGSHLLPVDETEGVTSGAVQPPGSTAHPEKTGDETDGGAYTDDEFHDAKEEEDLDAEEMRLIMNAGSGIPIVDGKPKPLLPPVAEKHKGRKLTAAQVLDMDETLLHSSFK